MRTSESDPFVSGRDVFPPTSRKELLAAGCDTVDVILFSGDAYIDHPASGTAIVARLIESLGLVCAVVPQPNIHDDLRDFKKFGRPRFFFGVTSGAVDSIVSHYTAYGRRRTDDPFTPGGAAGARPDYAVDVYTSVLKKIYPDVPVVAGGIEASLRRITHYDFYQNAVRPSVLVTSGADLLVYGMGEKPLISLVALLKKGVSFETIKDIPQTAYFCKSSDFKPRLSKSGCVENDICLKSHQDILKQRDALAENYKTVETFLCSGKIYAHAFKGKKRPVGLASLPRMIQKSGEGFVVINPPFPPLTSKELDKVYTLPFTRLPHPRYRNKKPIPAYDMIRFSVTLHRGCTGGCAFCSIFAHQGKFITSRSEKSVLNEVRFITSMQDFKGNLSDAGGPTANMYKMSGINPSKCFSCGRASCLYPDICENFNVNHGRLLGLYKKISEIPEVKKLFIGSGIRYDLVYEDALRCAGKPVRLSKFSGSLEVPLYLKTLLENHVSGRFKTAPEHTEDHVLNVMRKPPFRLFERLVKDFEKIKNEHQLKHIMTPYMISGHPGCFARDMENAALKLKKYGIKPRQVQGFTPTPLTCSTAIYCSGKNPFTGKKVFSEHDPFKKKKQNETFFWYKKKRSPDSKGS